MPVFSARHMKMKILLCGCHGQLGRALSPLLATYGQVTAIGRNDVDFTDLAALRACLAALRPGLIVNAAAYTDVDKAESHRDEAFAINAAAPGALADWAATTGAALLHYSTDYVFDGRGTRPWTEADIPAPLNVYGESKRAGDAAVLGSGAAALILRTSWLYAAEGRNFLRAMLRLGAEREELAVVADQVGAPTPAPLLAEITAEILRLGGGDPAGLFREKGGLVNAAANGATSWHGFAQAIFDVARRHGTDLRLRRIRPIPAADYPAFAVRPLNSRLDLTLLRDRFGIRPPDWRRALEAVMPAPDGHADRRREV